MLKKIMILISILVLVVVAILVMSVYSEEKSAKQKQPTNPSINEEGVEQTQIIKLYFGNSKLDPEALDCSKNFEVSREVLKAPGIARLAVEELLQGPTVSEKNDGYFTSINSGVKINKISIENGVAKIDFSDELEKNIGGSCRVTAIRSQIVNTLKQFETVNDVVISVNDRVEDVLQP